MTDRNRESELLFQRLEASRPEHRDPEMERAAARAVEAWPLLARLAPRVEPAARPMPLRTEIGELGDAASPVFGSAPAAQPPSALDQLFARLDRAAAAKRETTPAGADDAEARVVERMERR